MHSRNARHQHGEGFWNPYSSLYRVACICDALAIPAVVLIWYHTSYPFAFAVDQAGHHRYPGLVISAAMMIVSARALLKIEQAIRRPEAYRWDLERALRWLALLAVMALALWMLA